MTDQTGFIFAATGADYVALARRAARTLRGVVPDARIDLFADVALDDAVFDRVHSLEHPSRRPKIEAMQRSRFERTIYLDADVICLTGFDDVFAVLDRFDIACCAEQRRNDRRNRIQLQDAEVPVAYPQLNGGLIAYRRSAAMDAFLSDWHRWVHDGTQRFDQHSFRVLLYNSDLRQHVLPAEYNVMFMRPFMPLGPTYCAPRMLHDPALHRGEIGDPETPLQLGKILNDAQVRQLTEMLGHDQTISHYVIPELGERVTPKPKKRGWRSRLRWLRRPKI